MVSLKRNSKLELVEAKGKRTRTSSIYTPGQLDDFKISRGKFSTFITCPRCFYLDRVKGIVSPSTPGWSLNETTDVLLKKEFDICRELETPHRILVEHGLNDIVPFKHDQMDNWRNSLHGGLQHHVENTNIILHGGVDDIWYKPSTNELIVVDYKSQAKNDSVVRWKYLSDAYHESYKTQLDVYAYLLSKMGFKVSPTGYFYVCNADRNAKSFSGQLIFEETLVPYECNPYWIEEKILEIYLNKTGLDKPKYWKFLLAFNSFRFAGILQGIAKRVIDGNNAGTNGFEVGQQTEPVAILGSQILKETF